MLKYGIKLFIVDKNDIYDLIFISNIIHKLNRYLLYFSDISVTKGYKDKLGSFKAVSCIKSAFNN